MDDQITTGQVVIRLALTGASGTGKSSIASAIAERLSLPMCPVGSRSVALDMGFQNPYDVDAAGKRAEFQRRLLNSKLEWESKHPSFVTDRAYLDNLAYSMTHSPETVDAGFVRDIHEASRLHTHFVFCPIRAVHNIGGDPSRVSEVAYHEQYEKLLISLLSLHIEGAPILWLTSSIRDERIDQVARFLG